ncbi:tRNA pseudouridine(55) synthase TruB [Chungangia koreensis]|uniref:tRNA pseudouridine synthase B n=1 Tax=Chungangia koreensis TaxID=752657 RepID=A0ABV8WZS8_9LACT
MQHGILPLWKEKGMTSHDCVFKLRKLLKTKRVGHTGTLDPNVEGVLPICVGIATKVAEYLTDAGKEYEAEVTIGSSTTTEDADGEIVSQKAPVTFNRNQLLLVLESLTGVITQTPPMYSAVKVNGKRLYEYARKGIEVERPSRQVTIYNLELLDERENFSGETVTFRIRIACSKGTYIRTLAVQIGEALEYPAHMSNLVRTRSGKFEAEDCITLGEAASLAEESALYRQLLPMDWALTDFPTVEIDESLLKGVTNGQVLPVHEMLNHEERLVFTRNGHAIAIYRKHPSKSGMMKPEKMFLENGREE